MSCIASSWSSSGNDVFRGPIAALLSPLSVDGVTDTKYFMQPETTERLSVTDIEHFTQEYKLGFIAAIRRAYSFLNDDLCRVSGPSQARGWSRPMPQLPRR